MRESKHHYVRNLDLASGASDYKVFYFGNVLSKHIRAVESSPNFLKPDKTYKAIQNHFDVPYYLTKYPDIMKLQLDPIAHYIRAGAYEGRDPAPWFSTRAYITRYPNVKHTGTNPFYHWITVGKDKGNICLPFPKYEEVASIVGATPEALQDMLIAKHKELRKRLDSAKLGEMVAKTAVLEPLVKLSWPQAFDVKLPPLHNELSFERIATIDALQKDAKHRTAKIVILCDTGRPEHLSGRIKQIVNKISQLTEVDEIVVVTTDEKDRTHEIDLGQCGIRIVNYASHMPKLEERFQQSILVEFVRSLQPSVCINLNSIFFWKVLGPYGKALSHSFDIICCLNSAAENILGFEDGEVFHKSYRLFDTVVAFFVFDEITKDRLIKQYSIPINQQCKISNIETNSLSFLKRRIMKNLDAKDYKSTENTMVGNKHRT